MKKKVLVLTFLLAVVFGIFFWQSRNLGNGYFKWLGAGILKVNPFKAQIDLDSFLSKDTGLDFSQSLPSASKEQIEEINEQEEMGQARPIVILQLTLGQIQEEVQEIAKEVERIDKEVQKLKTLFEIQEQIKEISEKVAELGQQVNGLS